jgi:hypothetical protein
MHASMCKFSVLRYGHLQSLKSRRRPRHIVRSAPGVTVLIPTLTILLPPLLHMAVRRQRTWTWSRAPHQMRVPLATMRLDRTLPSNLSHRVPLPTMGQAGTLLGYLKIHTVLDPTILGVLMQVCILHTVPNSHIGHGLIDQLAKETSHHA